MILTDQSDRDRFARETARNFSVIAPAGVGKTTAITARVLAIARTDAQSRARGVANHAPLLPKLVVVTYTKKAADELRTRTRDVIVADGLPSFVLGWFNEAFFGTIHSFCIELLRRFGPLAGLPTRFAVEDDDAALRLAFQRDTADVATFLPESARVSWRRYGLAEDAWTLVWDCPSAKIAPPAPGTCPQLNFSEIFSSQPKQKRVDTLENIRAAQQRLQRWMQAPASARALGVPEADKGGKDFVKVWNDAMLPLREWLAVAAAHAAFGLAAAYNDFKERQGRLGYDDFVRLAGKLLRDSDLAARIRSAGYSVLLDEAQDTDPAQFAVLIGVTQPASASGLWTEGEGAAPAPGRFSMVGDAQQAIYDRSDVYAYQRLHQRLIDTGSGEALIFSVTMRCDEAIVAGVNQIFPNLLHGQNGQAKFEYLQSRPTANSGGIWRFPIARPEYFSDKAPVAERLRVEAAALARWLASVGPAGLGVENWSQVAVLTPRKKSDWMGALAAALRANGLRAQEHTGNRVRGTEPARTWLGAILGVLADPVDVFELVGVLREVFGISDEELFHWRNAHQGQYPRVAAAVELLRQVRDAIAGCSLRDTVAVVVETMQLKERLAAIAVASSVLESLLDQAALAEANGDHLATFAQQLRGVPADPVEPVVIKDELQLLTFHKAKGLEWRVVILFGLFREPRFATLNYPRWLPSGAADQPPVCIYDKHHASAPRNTQFASEREQQAANFARLLYVSATRPKQTLIVVDASALGADEHSLADVLGLLPGGQAEKWWNQLPKLDAPIITNEKNTEISSPPISKIASPAFWSLPRLGPISFSLALTRAKSGPRRIRPSTLARHGVAAEREEPDLSAPPDFPEEQPPPAAAVNYGNWWHTLMENSPWADGPVAWAANWKKLTDTAPDPARALAEIARMLASSLAAQLSTPGLKFITEMPFLWLEPDGTRVFDGCMDLAVWDEAKGRWLVIDWKTDHVDSDPVKELLQRYGPQLEVYARALQTIYNAPVEAYIYSTRMGVSVSL